jgi:predicted regulator of Ras-like GTPase activity (Roadblock/LC7/MglB family)
MTSHLRVVLESAVKSPGVVAGALIDSQGHVIEGACCVEGDLAASGASAGKMLRQWASVGADLGIGALQSMQIERPGGPATITPLGQDIALLIIGGHSCRPGFLHFQARRAREAMGEADRMVSEPGVSTQPQIPDPLDLVVASEEVSPAPPSRLTTGEVVLVGAHTFLLVTKLVTQLLQMKGVQSSRLRAYSPNSTIVDVMLEDGASLEAIDRSRLEEFLVERVEMGGTRLVLRASRSLAAPTPIGTRG